MYWKQGFRLTLVPATVTFAGVRYYFDPVSDRPCVRLTLRQCDTRLMGVYIMLILAPTETAYETSYWSSIVTLILSCHVSDILELLYAESHIFAPHPYFSENFGDSL